jgi:hypothetical protein
MQGSENRKPEKITHINKRGSRSHPFHHMNLSTTLTGLMELTQGCEAPNIKSKKEKLHETYLTKTKTKTTSILQEKKNRKPYKITKTKKHNHKHKH